MKSKSPKNRIVIYSVLVVMCCLVLFSYNKQKEYNNLKEVLTKDKQDLQNELTKIVADYKNLKVKNKKLSKRVINEINKIISLKKSVDSLKVENFELIRTYRQRTAKLQEENRLLIFKIDSLNTVNKSLKQENLLVKESLDQKDVLTEELHKKNVTLAKVNNKLKKEIAPARKIRTSQIQATALRTKSNGKLSETTKHDRTDAIRINFKLLQNELTPAGNKKILIQLVDENDNVVSAKSNLSTLKNNIKIKYSDKLIAEYKNEEIDVLSLILVDRINMEKGDYRINVFIDGDYSSSSVVTLR